MLLVSLCHCCLPTQSNTHSTAPVSRNCCPCRLSCCSSICSFPNTSHSGSMMNSSVLQIKTTCVKALFRMTLILFPSWSHCQYGIVIMESFWKNHLKPPQINPLSPRSYTELMHCDRLYHVLCTHKESPSIDLLFCPGTLWENDCIFDYWGLCHGQRCEAVTVKLCWCPY